MAVKLTRLTHKIAIQLRPMAESFAVLAPGGQSGNFWIHPRMSNKRAEGNEACLALSGSRIKHYTREMKVDIEFMR
jgi:hypothetical protein